MMAMPELAMMIQQFVEETGQPVVIFQEGGKLQIGVLDGQPRDVDWYFSPVDIEKSDELGLKELAAE